VAKSGRKRKGFSLTFLLLLASLSKMEQVAKNGRKVKAIALLFCCFCPLFKNEISG
jgi:hypothetical protein